MDLSLHTVSVKTCNAFSVPDISVTVIFSPRLTTREQSFDKSEDFGIKIAGRYRHVYQKQSFDNERAGEKLFMTFLINAEAAF